jgi:hypothetical protein
LPLKRVLTGFTTIKSKRSGGSRRLAVENNLNGIALRKFLDSREVEESPVAELEMILVLILLQYNPFMAIL